MPNQVAKLLNGYIIHYSVRCLHDPPVELQLASGRAASPHRDLNVLMPTPAGSTLH